ncbi:DUF523 domain-containing protein [Pseudobacteriovorax antillogorgiicola]
MIPRGKILVSACFLGHPVRYDGQAKTLDRPLLQEWNALGYLTLACPELAGGLPVPRQAAEIVGGQGLEVLNGTAEVFNRAGYNVSSYFLEGAHKTLQMALHHGVIAAFLKQRSPSCGTREAYDGTFSGQVITGIGVTAALLQQKGIPAFGEDQWDKLLSFVT